MIIWCSDDWRSDISIRIQPRNNVCNRLLLHAHCSLYVSVAMRADPGHSIIRAGRSGLQIPVGAKNVFNF